MMHKKRWRNPKEVEGKQKEIIHETVGDMSVTQVAEITEEFLKMMREK
jgi:hypothetical protein